MAFVSWQKGATLAAAVEAEVSLQNPLPTQAVVQSAAAAITPSDTVTTTAGREFVVNCSVAGNVKVGFVGGGTLVFPVVVGLTRIPWAVNQVFVTLTTATATYNNLS